MRKTHHCSFLPFSATGGRQGGGVGPGIELPPHLQQRGAAPGAAGGRAPLRRAGVPGAVPRVGRQAKQPQRHLVAQGKTG